MGQIVGLLCSPIVGGIAGLLYPTKECSTIPGTDVFGYEYPAAEVCNDKFNEVIGYQLTLVGWGIVALWVVGGAIAGLLGRQSSPNPEPSLSLEPPTRSASSVAQINDKLICPECGFEAASPQGLGTHRYRAHGVQGRSRQKRKNVPRKQADVVAKRSRRSPRNK